MTRSKVFWSCQRLREAPRPRPRFRPPWLLTGAIVLALAAAQAAAAVELTVDAPPALAATARQVRSLDLPGLERSLVEAGLEPPSHLTVFLIPEDDARARRREKSRRLEGALVEQA